MIFLKQYDLNQCKPNRIIIFKNVKKVMFKRTILTGTSYKLMVHISTNICHIHFQNHSGKIQTSIFPKTSSQMNKYLINYSKSLTSNQLRRFLSHFIFLMDKILVKIDKCSVTVTRHYQKVFLIDYILLKNVLGLRDNLSKNLPKIYIQVSYLL